MKMIRPFVGIAALALIAAACGGGGEAADTTSTSTSSTTSTTTTIKATTTTAASTTSTTMPATLRQPLTGEPVESVDDIIQRPALVAKIDNNAAAVPNHSGLAVADIVFEEVVEGRTTRFAAVFHSQSSDPLGPIRSGRTQDIALFSSFNAPLFVWSGGNPGRHLPDQRLDADQHGTQRREGVLPWAGQRTAQPVHDDRQHLVPDSARPAGTAATAVPVSRRGRSGRRCSDVWREGACRQREHRVDVESGSREVRAFAARA